VLTALRRERTSWLIVITAAFAGCAAAVASAAPAATPRIAAGTYKGAVRCSGSDRFSSGAATRNYRSSPTVTISFGAAQHLRRWTYLFLGTANVAVQSRAVHAGQSFTYSAGKHIGKPGRTRVTVAALTSSAGAVQLSARLDWTSPSTGYFGAGTYALLLQRVGSSKLRYEALKVVLKQPHGAPSHANPIVRRDELCVGQLSR
jgi:hypothetical protein